MLSWSSSLTGRHSPCMQLLGINGSTPMRLYSYTLSVQWTVMLSTLYSVILIFVGSALPLYEGLRHGWLNSHGVVQTRTKFHGQSLPSAPHYQIYIYIYQPISWSILKIKILYRFRRVTANNLTHWGRVTHICVGKLTIIGSDNGLSPGRRQANIWSNAGILLIWPLGTNFSELLIEIITFSFKKMRLKVSSAKWRPCCLGLNVLT